MQMCYLYILNLFIRLRTRLVILLFLISGFSTYSHSAFAANEIEMQQQSKTERYIQYVYDRIKFPKNHQLKFDAFRNGFYGYLAMIESGQIKRGATLTICDFNLSSNQKRLWVMDIQNKKVLFNSLVAHGVGTGDEFAVNFSNVQDSHQSSLGFYKTAETYTGSNGYSLRLQGLDGNFNNKAYERDIVIHGAGYVSEEFAQANQRIGRSYGCPALPVDVAPKVIDRIKNDQCFFIYRSSKEYLKNSTWLSKKINHLPEEAEFMDLNLPSNTSRSLATHNFEDTENPASALSPLAAKKLLAQEGATASTLARKGKKLPIDDRKITSIIMVQERADGTTDTLMVK